MSDHHHDDHLERLERIKTRHEECPEFYRKDDDDDYVPPKHMPLSRGPAAEAPGYESWPAAAVIPHGPHARVLMDAMQRIRSSSDMPFTEKFLEELYENWYYFETGPPFEPMPPLPKDRICRFIWSLTIERRMLPDDAPLLELLGDALEQLTMATSWYEHDESCSCYVKGILKEWSSPEAITMINTFLGYAEIAKLYQVSIIQLNGIKH